MPDKTYNSQTLLADEVADPELLIAAGKFGGAHILYGLAAPVLNKELANPDYPTTEISGACLYHPPSGFERIIITNKSLSLLAHEGMHRLIHKNLIPQDIFAIMARRGRARQTALPVLNPAPPTPPRLQDVDSPAECVCVFVQLFYRENALARRYLTGMPVPFRARLRDWGMELREIYQDLRGEETAKVRRFLRGLERGRFATTGPEARGKISAPARWSVLHGILARLNQTHAAALTEAPLALQKRLTELEDYIKAAQAQEFNAPSTMYDFLTEVIQKITYLRNSLAIFPPRPAPTQIMEEDWLLCYQQYLHRLQNEIYQEYEQYEMPGRPPIYL